MHKLKLLCFGTCLLAGGGIAALLGLKAAAVAFALDVGSNVGDGGLGGSVGAGGGSLPFDPMDLPYVGPEPGGGSIGDHSPSRSDGLGDPIDPDTGQPMRTPYHERAPHSAGPAATPSPSPSPSPTPSQSSPWWHPVQHVQDLAKEAIEKSFNPDYAGGN